MDQAYAVATATCFSQAWQQLYGEWPPLHAVVLCLSQGEAETRNGRAWPKSNNVGACTLRALNAAERAAVSAAGLVPTIGAGHEDRAQAAQAAIAAADLPLPQGEIHCDSAPSIGAYFCWFATFPTLVEGFVYYLRIACGRSDKRKPLFAVATDPNSSVDAYARTAFFQGYYTGMHRDDPEANIRAYVAFMGQFVPSFQTLLTAAGFDPSACEPVPAPFRALLQLGDSGEDVREVQGYIGAPQDGAWGPKTQAFLEAFRALHGLPKTPAVWDDACRAAYLGTPFVSDPVMARLQSVELGINWDDFAHARDAEIELT